MGALFAPLLPYKWAAIGVAFAGVLVFAGVEYVGKIQAQAELADYQRQAVEVINARLIENAAVTTQNQKLAGDVDASYLKGLNDANDEFLPLQDELDTLRTLWGAHNPAGVRGPNDAGTVPARPEPAGGGPVRACTDDAGGIVAAAAGVVKDLAACRKQTEQLEACRTWAMSVRCSAPAK